MRIRTTYLASPNSAVQADKVKDMPVLLSYGVLKRRKWIKSYAPTFSKLLIDSGAYSLYSSGEHIDPLAYKDWYANWEHAAEAVAGVDDIAGDWRKSLRNYEVAGGFPTFHITDPPELLPDLVDMCVEKSLWLGIGMLPNDRKGKDDWLRSVLDQVPDSVHVHGWALRYYKHFERLDSIDSTNWWRDAMKIKTYKNLSHLTYAECLEIIVKRYRRNGVEALTIGDDEAVRVLRKYKSLKHLSDQELRELYSPRKRRLERAII